MHAVEGLKTQTESLYYAYATEVVSAPGPADFKGKYRSNYNGVNYTDQVKPIMLAKYISSFLVFEKATVYVL